jgi:hypothetical protein
MHQQQLGRLMLLLLQQLAHLRLLYLPPLWHRLQPALPQRLRLPLAHVELQGLRDQ